jgi:predicted component of type VI protein secretion system
MAAQFQFVMRSGPNAGKVFPLTVQEVSIGRDNSNTVAINDAEVSRKHAKMTLHGNAYVIQDLGSTNGTYVNGTRVTATQVLNPGDSVSFGEGIVLAYESAFDSGATVISQPKPSRTAARAARAEAAPAPAYAGQVPSSPVPAAAAPAKKRGSKVVLIVVGLVVLCLVLGCVGSLLYVDADPTGARWCSFPFSLIAQMMGATCP